MPTWVTPAACPICSGGEMAGGSRAKETAPVSKPISTEWSFMKCYAVGFAFRAQEERAENAKTVLELRKRLVNVEIQNFKSKKESAIMPLVENFSKQSQDGNKTKTELKQIADNILLEIKNGPPYVYN